MFRIFYSVVIRTREWFGFRFAWARSAVDDRHVVRRVCPVRTAPLITCNRALYRVSRTTRERSRPALDYAL